MDQAPMEEEVVGRRFHRTDYELVDHYLKRKLQKIDDNRCGIPVVNIYNHDPDDLCTLYNGKISRGYSTGCFDCYFLCPRNNTNPNSTGTRRQTIGGYWKETGQKHDVIDEKTGKTIGTKRILVFFRGKQGNPQETDLAMHEYHLNADSADTTIDNPMAFSICHVKKKERSKMGDSKRPRSEKGNNPPSGEAESKGNSKRQRTKKGNPPSGKAESSFRGEALVESQIPRTEPLSFGCSDITTGATNRNEGTATSGAHAREDGLSLLDLDSDFDDVDKMIKLGWILDEPCDPAAH